MQYLLYSYHNVIGITMLTDLFRLRIGERSVDVFSSLLVHRAGCRISGCIFRIRSTMDKIFSINWSIVRNDYYTYRIAVFVTKMYLCDGRRRSGF